MGGPVASNRSHGIYSVLDQGVCSLANFLAFVLVARSNSPDAAGIYGLMFATLTMLSGIQNALITGPMKILGADRMDGDKDAYWDAARRLQEFLAVGLALASVVPVAGLLGLRAGLAFAAACFLQQMQQFVRASLITTLDTRRLLMNDFLVHGIRVTLIGSLFFLGGVAPIDAFLALGMGSLVGIMIGFPVRRGLVNEWRSVGLLHWQFGRWLLLETVAFYASTTLYLFLVAGLLGATQAGIFSALQNLLNVVNVFILGIVSVAPTIIRRALNLGGASLWRSAMLKFAATCVGVAVIFVFAVNWKGGEVLALLYHEQYAAAASFIPLFGCVYILSAINLVMAGGFRTINRPDVGAWAKLGSAVAAVLGSSILISRYSIGGAIAGLLITQIFWSMAYLWCILRGMMSTAAVEAGRQQ